MAACKIIALPYYSTNVKLKGIKGTLDHEINHRDRSMTETF